ncbi:hypothetical protein M8J76_009821 [Diaphorina citri]|nr:hypothetical protein M8J76_009821 [Diaphorina citri]
MVSGLFILECYIEPSVLEESLYRHCEVVIFSCGVYFVQQFLVVNRVVSCCQVDKGYAGYHSTLEPIFNVLGEVENLSTTRFSGAETSLLRDEFPLKRRRYSVQD